MIVIFGCVLYIGALVVCFIYENSKHYRIKKNRYLIERGYGFILDEEEREEALSKGNIEVLKPFQNSKVISSKKTITKNVILTVLVLGISGCQTTAPFNIQSTYIPTKHTNVSEEMALARCRMGIQSLPPIIGGTALVQIAVDQARSKQYMDDCMIAQGYKIDNELVINKSSISNGVYLANNDKTIKGCKFLQVIKGSSPFYGIFYESALSSAAKQASQETRKSGGDTFLVTSISSESQTGTRVSGKAYRCK